MCRDLTLDIIFKAALASGMHRLSAGLLMVCHPIVGGQEAAQLSEFSRCKYAISESGADCASVPQQLSIRASCINAVSTDRFALLEPLAGQGGRLRVGDSSAGPDDIGCFDCGCCRIGKTRVGGTAVSCSSCRTCSGAEWYGYENESDNFMSIIEIELNGLRASTSEAVGAPQEGEVATAAAVAGRPAEDGQLSSAQLADQNSVAATSSLSQQASPASDLGDHADIVEVAADRQEEQEGFQGGSPSGPRGDSLDNIDDRMAVAAESAAQLDSTLELRDATEDLQPAVDAELLPPKEPENDQSLDSAQRTGAEHAADDHHHEVVGTAGQPASEQMLDTIVASAAAAAMEPDTGDVANVAAPALDTEQQQLTLDVASKSNSAFRPVADDVAPVEAAEESVTLEPGPDVIQPAVLSQGAADASGNELSSLPDLDAGMNAGCAAGVTVPAEVPAPVEMPRSPDEIGDSVPGSVTTDTGSSDNLQSEVHTVVSPDTGMMTSTSERHAGDAPALADASDEGIFASSVSGTRSSMTAAQEDSCQQASGNYSNETSAGQFPIIDPTLVDFIAVTAELLKQQLPTADVERLLLLWATLDGQLQSEAVVIAGCAAAFLLVVITAGWIALQAARKPCKRPGPHEHEDAAAPHQIDEPALDDPAVEEQTGDAGDDSDDDSQIPEATDAVASSLHTAAVDEGTDNGETHAEAAARSSEAIACGSDAELDGNDNLHADGVCSNADTLLVHGPAEDARDNADGSDISDHDAESSIDGMAAETAAGQAAENDGTSGDADSASSDDAKFVGQQDAVRADDELEAPAERTPPTVGDVAGDGMRSEAAPDDVSLEASLSAVPQGERNDDVHEGGLEASLSAVPQGEPNDDVHEGAADEDQNTAADFPSPILAPLNSVGNACPDYVSDGGPTESAALNADDGSIGDRAGLGLDAVEQPLPDGAGGSTPDGAHVSDEVDFHHQSTASNEGADGRAQRDDEVATTSTGGGNSETLADQQSPAFAIAAAATVAVPDLQSSSGTERSPTPGNEAMLQQQEVDAGKNSGPQHEIIGNDIDEDYELGLKTQREILDACRFAEHAAATPVDYGETITAAISRSATPTFDNQREHHRGGVGTRGSELNRIYDPTVASQVVQVSVHAEDTHRHISLTCEGAQFVSSSTGRSMTGGRDKPLSPGAGHHVQDSMMMSPSSRIMPDEQVASPMEMPVDYGTAVDTEPERSPDNQAASGTSAGSGDHDNECDGRSARPLSALERLAAMQPGATPAPADHYSMGSSGALYRASYLPSRGLVPVGHAGATSPSQPSSHSYGSPPSDLTGSLLRRSLSVSNGSSTTRISIAPPAPTALPHELYAVSDQQRKVAALMRTIANIERAQQTLSTLSRGSPTRW